MTIAGVDAGGCADGGDDGAPGPRRARTARGRAPSRLRGRPRPSTEVAVERRVEALVEQHLGARRRAQRQGRYEERAGDVERRLRLARALPVEVEARVEDPVAARAASETAARPSPGGDMSAFCEPETTTSRPQASVSHGAAPRLETASARTSAPASLAAAARGAGRRRRLPWTSRSERARRPLASRSLSLGAQVVRVGCLSPRVAEHVHVRAERGRHRDPALSEAPGGDHEDAARPAKRGWQRPTRRRRCPRLRREARRSLVRQTSRRRPEHALVPRAGSRGCGGG